MKTIYVEPKLLEQALQTHNVRYDHSRIRRGRSEIYLGDVLVAIYDPNGLKLTMTLTENTSDN